MNLSNPTRFRRTVAGSAMIAAPLVFVVAEILHARFESDAARQLDAIAADTGRWYAAHALLLTSLVLALPAFFGLVHLLEQKRPLLGNLGLIAFVPGLVALAAVVGVELVAWQMAQPDRDRAEMISLWESTAENAGIVPLILVVLLFPIAWLLAGIGLYAARLVPTWSAALVGLAQLVGFSGELSGGPKWLAVAAQVAFAIGLIPIGVRILRQSDASWEAPRIAGEPPLAPA
ncbi:MAG TPA: hypothetical protein VI409_05730 [Gaiellaceae bacterium]|nr:hypothetical protein [Gaiellaceae bacterium]